MHFITCSSLKCLCYFIKYICTRAVCHKELSIQLNSETVLNWFIIYLSKNLPTGYFLFGMPYKFYLAVISGYSGLVISTG